MKDDQIIAFIGNLITDIRGARDVLAARAGVDEYNRQTLHYHVQKGNLAAYIFVGSELVRWDRGNPEHHKGKEYLFLKSDVQAMPLNGKVGRKPKQRMVECDMCEREILKGDAVDIGLDYRTNDPVYLCQDCYMQAEQEEEEER